MNRKPYGTVWYYVLRDVWVCDKKERERGRVRQPLSGVRRQKINDILREEKSMTPLFETETL